MNKCQHIHSCLLTEQKGLRNKNDWEAACNKKEHRRREKDRLARFPLVPWVIFLCGVVQFSVNSTWQPCSRPSLIAPSHLLVATQLQIKDAHVLGDFTDRCPAVARSGSTAHSHSVGGPISTGRTGRDSDCLSPEKLQVRSASCASGHLTVTLTFDLWSP